MKSSVVPVCEAVGANPSDIALSAVSSGTRIIGHTMQRIRNSLSPRLRTMMPIGCKPWPQVLTSISFALADTVSCPRPWHPSAVHPGPVGERPRILTVRRKLRTESEFEHDESFWTFERERFNRALFWAFCTREFLQPISSLKRALVAFSFFPSSARPPSPTIIASLMSDSPEDARAASEDAKVDEIDDSGEPEASQQDPAPKRKRGRPPGSKNKKTIAAEAAKSTAGSSTDAPRRPRGRPPKRKAEEEKKPDEGSGEPSEAPPKKKRGRPRKNPLPAERTGGDGGGADPAAEPSQPKRKRGRPRKDSS